jgi:hypothetical protein
MSTVHNPVNFEPKDYEVEEYLDNKRPEYCGEDREAFELLVKDWEADMERTLGADWRAKAHHCIHCGNARVRWITAVRHVLTGECVVFGAVCTHRLGFADKHAFKLAQLQARAEARKIRFAIYEKRKAFIAQNPGIKDVLDHINDPVHAKNMFVQDVMHNLDKWGTLSPRQVEAVLESMKKDVERATRLAAEAAEPKGDAPSGRVRVTGVVLATRWQEHDFGQTLKMLVKLENGSKVWCSAPSRETIERGDTITFTATFEVSRDDKSFAFGKRPHLVSRVAAV